MGMFASRIAAAKPGDSTGLLFDVGQYPLVQLRQLKMIESKDPRKGNAELFIIVCDILESHVGTRPAGTQEVACILNGNHPSAENDAKRFIKALLPDVDENTINTDGINALCSSVQPMTGRLLALEVYVKKNQKDPNKQFTKHVWRPVPQVVQAQAPALRAKAGLSPITFGQVALALAGLTAEAPAAAAAG